MKSIFWSGGWIRTIDLQGPFPWCSATELRHLNIYQLCTMGYLKGARYSRTERMKPKINLNNNNTITSSPGELTRMHFKQTKIILTISVDLGRVGRSCLRRMAYPGALPLSYRPLLCSRSSQIGCTLVMQNIINT